MKTITTSTELKEAISLLEIEQELKGYALKDQFNRAYDSLKPVSIFKSLTKGAITTPNIIGNVLSTSIGLATGFYTNKLIAAYRYLPVHNQRSQSGGERNLCLYHELCLPYHLHTHSSC